MFFRWKSGGADSILRYSKKKSCVILRKSRRSDEYVRIDEEMVTEKQGSLELQSRKENVDEEPVASASAWSNFDSGAQIDATPTTEIVTLKVSVHCQGCARRLKKALIKQEGVHTFHIDVDQKKLTVVGTLGAATVLELVCKHIKGTELWSESVGAVGSQ